MVASILFCLEVIMIIFKLYVENMTHCGIAGAIPGIGVLWTSWHFLHNDSCENYNYIIFIIIPGSECVN